ncbi:hypothetical protein ACIRPT_12975 [Streptomyces sp. NPDC101227]
MYEDDEIACGEGHCQCYCIGAWHPCGCDCPRCPCCQQHPHDCDCE